ncbi:MAG: hypothetical protein R3265_14385, partial [Hyphomonas sp.]|nr:hypothetical protein [Hyphomonas sp.]
LQPALAEEIADRLAGWAAEGDRAVILLQHAASTFGWPGLDRNRLELAPTATRHRAAGLQRQSDNGPKPRDDRDA